MSSEITSNKYKLDQISQKYYMNIVPITNNVNKFWMKSGELGSGNNYTAYEFPVIQECLYHIKGYYGMSVVGLLWMNGDTIIGSEIYKTTDSWYNDFGDFDNLFLPPKNATSVRITSYADHLANCECVKYINKKYNITEVKLNFIQDYYYEINNSGPAVANGYCYAEVDASAGETYIIQSVSKYRSRAYVICNNNTVLKFAPEFPGYFNEEIVMPQGTTKLVINSVTSSEHNIANYATLYKLTEIEQKIRYKHHKSIKWVAIGDSITDIITLTTSDKNYKMPNYVNFVSEWLGITNVINKGASGTGFITNNSGHSSTYVERCTSIESDVDLITIYGSFNDTYDNNYTIGTINDESPTTLYGAIKTVINILYSKNPEMHIIIITPAPWASTNAVNGSRKNIATEYVEVLINVAQMYSLPIVDLFHNSGMHPWDNTFKEKYYYNGDGCHPLSKAHKEYIAPLIASKISDILFLK